MHIYLVYNLPIMTNESSAGRQIARAASVTMIAIVISNLVGLARQIIIAHNFGTSIELEAFFAANRVAEVLFNLMAGGALASAFVPTFTGLLVKDEKEHAWKLASGVLNLLVCILIFFSVLTAIFAPWIVQNLLAPGFSPEKQQLTIRLLRILMPSVVVFGLSGLMMGVLNANRNFFIPTLTPAMYSFGMIFGVVVLSPQIGIFGLAWGAVIGSILHLSLQIPSLLKLKGTYFPSFDLADPLIRRVGRLMLPRLFGAAIVQLNFWVNTLIASFLPDGSLNGVVYAFQLMLMPQAAIAQSIAIAAMPTFSAQAALEKMDDLRKTLASSLRGMLLLAIPASIGLMILRTSIVGMIYQGGVFTNQSTTLVSWVLLWYAAGLVGHSMVEVLSRAFYVLHDTRTPVIVGAIAMGLNLVFSILFTRLFSNLGWLSPGGLALANSLATALEMVGLLILLRNKLQSFNGDHIWNGFFKALAAGGAMALALLVWITFTSPLSYWIQALGGILLGGSVYTILLWLFRIPEINIVTTAIRRRLHI